MAILSVFDPTGWDLAASLVVFAVCAVVIAVFGTRLTAVVDKLADRTGIGEAIAGAVLLGATTSLSGSVLSISAAWHGRAELALGNALGGIAVQTAFLAVADIFHRRANLEHAAASAANMMQAALLVCLLSILLLAASLPEVTLWKVHVATPLLVATYLYGLHLVKRARTQPMWRPERTAEIRTDVPERGAEGANLYRLWGEFALQGLAIGAAGLVLEQAASRVSTLTDLSEAFIGVMLTSVSTSLPELITSVAAVRRGALTLAVSGIIGGNAFDTLFAAFADVAYRSGSIYHAMSDVVAAWIALSILMTSVVVMGLIRRERRGIAAIGLESFVILLLYGGAVVLMTMFT